MKPLDIVNRFLDLTSLRGREITALLPQIEPLLAEDFVFTGPLMKIEGRGQYLGLLGQFLGAHADMKIVRQFAEGDEVCSIDELTVRSPTGQLVRMPMAEWFRLKDGVIASHTIYYDPREFAEAFGM